MAELNFKNQWVLVTGASSGLGRSIAMYLASVEEANLVITARRLERLQKLKNEIESNHKVAVKIIQADLGKATQVDRLYEQAVRHADIFALINNAGFTYYGRTKAEQLSLYDKMIKINLMALIRLSLYFLDFFKEKGRGAILNVTSGAGFCPTPYQNVYSASKHAAQVFTEALAREKGNDQIVISSFAPGGIATEMIDKAALTRRIARDSLLNMKADVVARKAVRAFKKKRYLVVPGIINKLGIFLTRLFPRRLVTWVMERVFRPPEISN